MPIRQIANPILDDPQEPIENPAATQRCRGVAGHFGNRTRVAATGSRTSSVTARSTEPDCWPVAGLYTACVRPLLPAARRPLMKGFTCFVITIPQFPR